MPSDELTAEIEKAASEIDINETIDEGAASEKAAHEAADASAQSDEARAAAEVAKVDDAAAKAAAESEALAQEGASEEGAAADAVGQEAAVKEGARLAAAKAAEAKSVDPVVISDGVLERAVAAGIPLATARGFADEATLSGLVDVVERQLEEAIRSGEQEVVPEKKDPFADLPKLDPEVHDAEVIKTFERYAEIAKAQQEKIEALQGRQEKMSSLAEDGIVADTERWFDGQVAGLGEEFSGALGKGGYRSLPQGSSQYAKREAIANQISVMAAGYTATGQSRPSQDELFKVAARLVLHEEYQAIDNKKLAGKLEGQASQHIQRVGGSKAASVQSPEDEAAALIDAKFG